MFYWQSKKISTLLTLILTCSLALLMSACNLTSAPQEQLDLTDVPTTTALPSRTPINTFPTPITVTTLPGLPTTRPTGQLPPTSIGVLPTIIPFPSSTPLPVNILIFSPVPGNVVAGNVQVLGAASHPQFLQYQLEYGPDSNPGNIWQPASGVVQLPIVNGLLGIWNTTAVPDGLYQLRLRVYLRDGTSLATVVNQIRVQNRAPTPVPTQTTIPRPIAAFTQDRVTGQAPLVVRFFNQSSGNITSHSWDFGDGSTSPEVNPTHTFRNPGIYTVRLRVTGPGGRSNVSRDIVVQGSAPPIASFTQSAITGPSPLTVQFTDRSTGNITGRSWNFGDGTTSNQTNPSHTFTAVGTYNVLLTVTGPGGSSSVRRQITVENPTIPEPIAALVASPTEGDLPLTVQFDATDSSGQIDSYNWAFGDGEFGQGEIITHTYQQAGTYEAELIVVGPGGQNSRTATITVTRPPDAPIAAFTANPESGDIPLNVQFDATGSSGQINSYNWDFGDGETGSGANVSHTFTTTGTYTVTLTVTGPGGENRVSLDISATEPVEPPEAAFEVSPSSGTAPLDVQFTNQTTGQGLTFTWNFGDGSPVSNETDPSHRYENPGEYRVFLRVQGESGSDTAEATISVTRPADPPIANFSAVPQSGNAPLEVQFTNQTAGADLTFLWNFGDNSPTSDEANPSHVYTVPGNYTVTLTVTGPGGNSQAQTRIAVSEEVVIAPPVASLTAVPNQGQSPLTVQFQAVQSDDITSYHWDFGDNTGTASGPSASYTYNAPGNYTVTLRVAGPGGEDTETTTISVSAPPPEAPVASFTASPTEGQTPLEVVFDASGSTGQIDSYSWDFGDNNGFTTGVQTNYTYTVPGPYVARLTVSGPGGENSTEILITVNEAETPPEEDIVGQTPVLPNLQPDSVRTALRRIYDNGAAQGKRANVFAIIGDNLAVQSGYLRPLADSDRDNSGSGLQGVIDWYRGVDLGEGRNSFDRRSTAANQNWRARDLLDPNNSDPNICNNGETPIECELRLIQPAVAIISVGHNDAFATDPAEFGGYMEQIIQIVLNNGVIPIVSTVQPYPPDAARINAINTQIIEAVRQVENRNNTTVPLYNLWRAYTELPDNGLQGDNVTPTVADGGPDNLNDNPASRFGINARNRHVMTILNALRETIYPEAP